MQDEEERAGERRQPARTRREKASGATGFNGKSFAAGAVGTRRRSPIPPRGEADQQASRNASSIAGPGAEVRKPEKGNAERTHCGAERVRRVEAARADSEPPASGGKGLAQQRDGAAHAEGRQEQRRDRQHCFDGGKSGGRPGQRLVEVGIEMIVESQQRLDEKRPQTGAQLKQSVGAQWSQRTNGAGPYHQAANRKPEKNSGQSGGDRRCRGAKNGSEAAHPQDFIDERQRSGKKQQRVKSKPEPCGTIGCGWDGDCFGFAGSLHGTIYLKRKMAGCMASPFHRQRGSFKENARKACKSSTLLSVSGVTLAPMMPSERDKTCSYQQVARCQAAIYH